ncbi:glycosyltransferase [Klebsiella michiganensis]|uniref:glycosyltransferase n=1 Tax=Klebsiella michiganensis TaxID=1134687 RepID=UPI001898A4C3|nr:glycosyltransferase [Klebsiella michiganensis]UKS48593.1 glycosyltransferase [Klebsiella michiganensis]
MDITKTGKKAAIIVTYYPDIERVGQFLDVIKDSVELIIIIDNTPNGNIDIPKIDNLIYVSLGKNFGIAYAQNEGLYIAIKHDVKYLYMFDQDSMVKKDFFSKMLISFEKISMREKVACIGPNIFDEKSTSEYIQKGFIISSGSLYDINIFKKVGVFNAGWFIDMIDVEWCHRAQKNGYKSFIINEIGMEHNTGENNYPKVFGKSVRIGSPIRQYYLIRNWILSLRSDSFSFLYKVKIIILLLQKIPLFMLCSPKIKRMKFIYKGICDGIKGRVGPYDEYL